MKESKRAKGGWTNDELRNWQSARGCRKAESNPFSRLVLLLPGPYRIIIHHHLYTHPPHPFNCTRLESKEAARNIIIMSSRTEPQAEGGPLRNKVLGFMGFGLAVRALQLGIQGAPLRFGELL